MKAYEVIAREEGQIAIFDNIKDAELLVSNSELADKKEGLYEEGYYTIKEYPVEKVINFCRIENFNIK